MQSLIEVNSFSFSVVYGSVGPVYRGCISQKNPMFAKMRPLAEKNNATPSTQDCFIDDSDENIEITRCFCKEDLCNSANSFSKAGLTLPVLLTVVWWMLAA